MGGSGLRSTARGSRPPRRAGPGRRGRRARIPRRTGNSRSACLAGYPRSRRLHARVIGGWSPRRVGMARAPPPRIKAVIVLTILLIIIVLLLLFGGGWGYSRRGRRI